MAKFKILLFNLGYCLGIDGSITDYIIGSYKYVYCPKKKKEEIISGIKNLIKHINPDLCSFIEIKKNQADSFKDTLFYDVNNKYGRGILEKLPGLKSNCNAVFYKKKLNKKISIKKHYFRYGTKKLVYEIVLPKNAVVFTAHFSLSKTTRKKQFREITKLVNEKEKQNKRVIVCGDFNIFGGYEELKFLMENTKLKIAGNNNKTFPAAKPKRNLDLFLCSQNLKVLGCRAIDYNAIKNCRKKLSDHLPVLLELKL